MKKLLVMIIAVTLTVFSACGQIMDGDNMINSYTQISQEEAKAMMSKDDDHIIVDVRRQDEYDAGHIPGAILIPNESIGTEPPQELPDLSQIILIYCRRGNRSKQAAQKLVDMGYTNIYEFGGINEWTGEIVTEDSMRTQDIAEALSPAATLVIEANGHIFYASFEDNSSADALKQKLNSEEIELELHDYGSFEKVGSLPWKLPQNDDTVTTVPGDVILYQGNQITIYYDENTWDFTRLAKINNTTKEELLEVLGYDNVKVKFRIEWSE